MNLVEAEVEIYRHIGEFTGIDTELIRIENQQTNYGKPFSSLLNKLWCKIFIQYAPSRIVGMGESPCKRSYGIISIQCFAPKNSGTLEMTALCDAWDKHLQSFKNSHLEIYLVHAPESVFDDDFYAKIIRAEFRVN